MENLDQHYFYNQQMIEDFVKEKGEYKLFWDIVYSKGINKSEIRKDVCDINDKRIELEGLDNNQKQSKFNEAYDSVVGKTQKKIIKGYKSLIGTMLNFLKTPQYKEYKEIMRDEIRIALDHKYALELKFGKDFIYKIDYLFKKHIQDMGNKLFTIEYIIEQINKGKIQDINFYLDEIAQERMKRLAIERYDSFGEIKD